MVPILAKLTELNAITGPHALLYVELPLEPRSDESKEEAVVRNMAGVRQGTGVGNGRHI
jgi:hypothetical protein